MKKKLALFAIVFSIVPFAFAEKPSIDSIPNGYIDGRSDVKYGTYTTVVQDSARSFQTRLKDLENKAYGLSKITQRSDLKQAELAYLLEFELIRLHMDIAAAPKEALTNFERNSLLFSTTQIYSDVRHHSERQFENMVRYIDHKMPGPNGLQIREEIEGSKKAESIYYPNYRSDEALSGAEKSAQYNKKLQEFTASGGSLKEISLLTSELIQNFKQYTRVEYVWLENGRIMITEGKAGHLLLASGKAVKAAGQIVFIKNPQNEISLLIVSNASGTYKPDLFSIKILADQMQKKFKISSNAVVLTQGEPLSTQAVKIYMKADGVDADISKQKSKELEARGKEMLLNPIAPRVVDCGFAFSK